jgi:hypothetical protein
MKIVWITYSTTELDGFQQVGVIKGNEFSDKVGPLGFKPKMEKEITDIQSATGIHEANEGRVHRGISAKIKRNMRKTVVNDNGHGRRNDTRFRSNMNLAFLRIGGGRVTEKEAQEDTQAVEKLEQAQTQGKTGWQGCETKEERADSHQEADHVCGDEVYG